MLTSYSIQGLVTSEDSPNFQAALKRAYDGNINPVCQCRHSEDSVMYVAYIKMSASYEVRSMPNKGGKHAAWCKHYKAPLSVSGLSQVMGLAVTELNAEEETRMLKLDFALSKVQGRLAPTPSDTPSDTVTTSGTKLTPRGLLHYLWGEAHLNRWYPNMAGKRWYSTMYRELLKVAAKQYVGKEALADILIIPEPYNEDKKSEQHAALRKALSRFSKVEKNTQRKGLFLGEVYSLNQGNFNFLLKLKSALDFPFQLQADIYKRMQKRFEKELAMVDDASSKLKLIAVGTFHLNAANIPVVLELALMVVTQNFIPLESIYEKDLIDDLTSQSRAFEKCLRLQMPQQAIMASAVTLDTELQHALFVVDAGAADGTEEKIQELCKVDGLTPWIWHTTEPMPALPPKLLRAN